MSFIEVLLVISESLADIKDSFNSKFDELLKRTATTKTVINELKSELAEKNTLIEKFESKLDNLKSDNNRNKFVFKGPCIVDLLKNNLPPSSESIKVGSYNTG